MPTFYNFTQDGLTYSFDDIFVPADYFTDGDLWTWGFRQLGINSLTDRSTPVTTFSGGVNWKQVSTGNNKHTAAIKTDGTLWTWGYGSNGKLGDNTVSDKRTPVTTFSGGTNWKQVSCGDDHTAAVKTGGTLWIWGQGTNAKLGTNDAVSRSTPVTTFAGGTNWLQVSSGNAHTAAIKTDGTLWIWGAGANGRLGNNATTNRSTPVTTFAGGNNWKQVFCGFVCTAAIKTDGTLWLWGLSGAGQLGNNSGSDRQTPVTTFAGGNNWKQVSCGGNHTAAIKTDGTLWIWGSGLNGILGNNNISNVLTPVTTFAGGTNWKQVYSSISHTAAIKTDGTLWIWGQGSYGMLGNNLAANRSTPVTTFAGGTNWKQVSAGYGITSAIKYDTELI